MLFQADELDLYIFVRPPLERREIKVIPDCFEPRILSWTRPQSPDVGLNAVKPLRCSLAVYT